MSITCAGNPCQKCLWGILGAQVIDRKQGYLPQKGLWRVHGRVLSFTCAGDPSQKWFWGILDAQVIDRKQGYPSQT